MDDLIYWTCTTNVSSETLIWGSRDTYRRHEVRSRSNGPSAPSSNGAVLVDQVAASLRVEISLLWQRRTVLWISGRIYSSSVSMRRLCFLRSPRSMLNEMMSARAAWRVLPQHSNNLSNRLWLRMRQSHVPHTHIIHNVAGFTNTSFENRTWFHYNSYDSRAIIVAVLRRPVRLNWRIRPRNTLQRP